MKISRKTLSNLIEEEFKSIVKGKKVSKGSDINERWLRMSGLLAEGDKFGSGDARLRLPSPEEEAEGPDAGDWRGEDFELWLSDTGYGQDLGSDPIGLVTKLAENAAHSEEGNAYEFAHQVAELYFKMFGGSH